MFCVTKWASAHFFLCPGWDMSENGSLKLPERGPSSEIERNGRRALLGKAEGLELVDLEFRKEARGWVLRIFMDKPGGVTLDDCSEISREIGDQIEVNDLIPHSYTLEVSSPGSGSSSKKRKRLSCAVSEN